MKMQELHVWQFGHIEEVPAKIFTLRYIVSTCDVEGCGQENRFALEPPSYPPLRLCEHVVGIEKHPGDMGPIWMIQYKYSKEVVRKPRTYHQHPHESSTSKPKQTVLLDFFRKDEILEVEK